VAQGANGPQEYSDVEGLCEYGVCAGPFSVSRAHENDGNCTRIRLSNEAADSSPITRSNAYEQQHGSELLQLSVDRISASVDPGFKSHEVKQLSETLGGIDVRFNDEKRSHGGTPFQSRCMAGNAACRSVKVGATLRRSGHSLVAGCRRRSGDHPAAAKAPGRRRSAQTGRISLAESDAAMPVRISGGGDRRRNGASGRIGRAVRRPGSYAGGMKPSVAAETAYYFNRNILVVALIMHGVRFPAGTWLRVVNANAQRPQVEQMLTSVFPDLKGKVLTFVTLASEAEVQDFERSLGP